MMLLDPLSPKKTAEAAQKARDLLSKLSREKAWDACAKMMLRRQCPIERRPVMLEPGVNFFVLALEAIGCQTFHSCEGHPEGFYVAFRAPRVDLAREIARCGYLDVRLGKPNNTYSIHLDDHVISLPGGRESALRGAAAAWLTFLLSFESD